jgi:hypothetical protein
MVHACHPVCVGRGELESVAMEEEGGASGGGTRSKKNDTTSDKSFSGAKFSIYELQLTIIRSVFLHSLHTNSFKYAWLLETI